MKPIFPDVNENKKKYDEAVEQFYKKYDNSTEYYRVNVFWEDVDEDTEEYITVITKYFCSGEFENLVVVPVVGVFKGNELCYIIEDPSRTFFEALNDEELDVSGEYLDEYTSN